MADYSYEQPVALACEGRIPLENYLPVVMLQDGQVPQRVGDDIIGVALSTTGDVDGPASATQYAVPRFANTSGKIIENTGILINPSNSMTIPGTLFVDTIREVTAAHGVDVDGVFLKDFTVFASGGEFNTVTIDSLGQLFVSTISESGVGLGVTVDGVLLKDSIVTAASVSTDAIVENTPDAGVTVETVLIKDGLVDTRDISVDGAKLNRFQLPIATHQILVSDAIGPNWAPVTIATNAIPLRVGSASIAGLTMGTNTVLGRVGADIVSASVVTGQIADDAVTYAKMQDVSATDRFLGRDTAGAGIVEEITPAAARTILNVADGANNYVHPNHTGDVTSVADGATTIATDAVTYAKFQDAATGASVLGRAAASAGDYGEITLAANTIFARVGSSSVGDFAIGTNTVLGRVGADIVAAQLATGQVADNAITYAKMQNVSATDKMLGRSTAGAGDVEEIACTAAGRALLDDADASAQRTTLGLGTIAVLASPLPIADGGTGQTAQTAAFDALAPTTTKGDVIVSNGSDNLRLAVGTNDHVFMCDSTTATGVKWGVITTSSIGSSQVTLSRIQNISTDKLLGRDTAGNGVVEEIGVDGTIVFNTFGFIGRTALTGDVTAALSSNATTIANDVVSDAKLRNSGACSVIGRSANSAGDPADISASANGQVLRRSADIVGFGAVDLADTDAVTGLLPVGNGGMGAAPVKITANQNSTSTTPADVTGLAFSVVSGRYYHFRFIIVFQSAATTTGLKVALTTPTFTIFSATTQIPTAAESSGRTYTGWITSSGDIVTAVGVEAANVDYLATINGIIVPSADGTLQLQFGTEVSLSQVICRKGSMGFLWDLGT